MYVNSLACVRVEVRKSEYFRIESDVRQGCTTSPVSLAFQRVYRCSDERSNNEDGEDESEISGGGKKMKIAWPNVCR